MKAKLMLEKDIERKLREQVEARGGKCLKWVCPGWSGVPDRSVLMPGGRIYFIETKRPKDGKLSALQLKWGEWLTRLGFDHWVIWNENDLADFIGYVNRALTPEDKRGCTNCEHYDTRTPDKPCRVCIEFSLWEPPKEEKHHDTD